MVKIFGRRISRGIIQRLGRRIGHKADVIGRKTLNTIDKIAPIASTLALISGNPEIAEAISNGQEASHLISDSTRAGVALATAKKANVGKRAVEFGDSAEQSKHMLMVY